MEGGPCHRQGKKKRFENGQIFLAKYQINCYNGSFHLKLINFVIRELRKQKRLLYHKKNELLRSGTSRSRAYRCYVLAHCALASPN